MMEQVDHGFFMKIAFRLNKTPQRIRQERDIRTAKVNKQRMANLKAKGRPHLSPADIAKTDRETCHTLDMTVIELQF